MISEATKRLIVRANELHQKEIELARARRAHYKRHEEMHEIWKAAKAACVAARGTAGELDAFRAWFAIDAEWNDMRRPEFSDDDKWDVAMKKAWYALAGDAGLHLSIPEDP